MKWLFRVTLHQRPSVSVQSVGNNLSSVLVLEDGRCFRVYLKPYSYLQQPALLTEVLYNGQVLIDIGGSKGLDVRSSNSGGAIADGLSFV